jgi:transposase-like protein
VIIVDHKARREDVAWMAATGESLSGAARRLGITASGLEKWCEKHGRVDDLNVLRSREPCSVFDPRAELAS